MLIDEMLPVWHKRERHVRRTDVDPRDLLRSVEELSWHDVAVFRALMRVRAAGRSMGAGTILDGMTQTGFVPLARGPHEIVYGAVGRPWRPTGGLVALDGSDPRASFVDFDRPGFAKMAFNFSVEAGKLATETRVLLTDRRARSAFGAYWLVVRPFSGWIRREWLAGVVRHATALSAPG